VGKFRRLTPDIEKLL